VGGWREDGRVWGLGVAVVAAGVAVASTARGSRAGPRTRDPRSVAIGETGRGFGTITGVGRAIAGRFHALVEQIDRLELEVDAAYEQGDLVRAQAKDVELTLAEEQLWAMHAAVEEQSELLSHGPIDAEQGVDEILVSWYQHYLDQESGMYGGYLDDADREQAKQNLARMLMEDFGLSELTPDEALVMAMRAWRDRRNLRGRYKTARRGAGPLEQVRTFLAGLGERDPKKMGSQVRVGPRLRVAPQKKITMKGKWREVEGRQPKWSWEVGDGTEYQVFFGRVSDWSEEGWSVAYFDSPDTELGDRVGTGLFTTRDAAMQHAVAHHRSLRSGSSNGRGRARPAGNSTLPTPHSQKNGQRSRTPGSAGSAVKVGPRLRPAPLFVNGERWLRVNRALHKLFASLLPVENDEWHQLLTLVPTGLRGKGALFGDDLPPLPIAFQDVVVRVHDDEDGTGLTVFTPHITNPRHRQGDRHGDHSWGPMHVNRAAAHLTDSLAVGFGFSPWTFDLEQRVKIAGGTWDGKYGTITGRNVSGGMGLSDRMRGRYADPSDLGWQSAEGEPAYLLELRPGGGGIWYSGEALSPVRERKS
jgi:hypothetical protein